MTKGQRGNKESKKPKKAQAPVVPAGTLPAATAVAASVAARPKKR